MPFRLLICILIAALFIPAAVPAAERIFKWTDENGVVHLTNIPPVQQDSKVEILELKPPQIIGNPEVERLQPDDREFDPYETAVTIFDSHVVVPATLNYNQRQVDVKLLLDTGSTNITLHREIADELGIDDTMKGSIRVAGGELIDAEGVILDSVTVGPHIRENLLAGIIEHRGPEVAYDGLLGMNFLRNYQYTIDFENQVLRWSK